MSDGDPGAALQELHRLKRKIRKTVNLLEAERRYDDLDSRIEAIADAVVARAAQQHQQSRLKDIVATFTSYRAQRIVRSHIDHHKRRQIQDILRQGLLRWETDIRAEDDFGSGLDERVVEIPLALETAALNVPGHVLDAGAALNHAFVRDAVGPLAADLVHFTQSASREIPIFEGSRVSYMFGDLRSMPFRDHYFDRVVCISTLEHVGMNNARYGGAAEDAVGTIGAAVSELLRVLAPGGTMLITVPFGEPAYQGWFRIFGPEDVDGLVAAAGRCTVAVRYYRFDGRWLSVSGGTAVIPSDGDEVRALAAIRLVK